jgi:hypothetical protein
MAVSWQTSPPYPNWREFAPRLNEYADDLITKPENRLPSGVTLREWLRENEPKLRSDPYQRSLNRLIAVQLLPLFQTFPQGWQIVRSVPSSDETFENIVPEWHRICPDEHEGFILQVAVLFGIKLGAKC